MPAQDPSPPGHPAEAGASPLRQALTYGQSIWLDNISRDLLLSGELRRWVEREGIRGVTSNPAIFEKAIARTSDYDPAARALMAQGADDAVDVFEKLAIQDIQLGCDVLRPVWEESGGRDGFVSLEVSPHLANDTEGTVVEARRLHAAVGRDNLMIKVPATPAGLPAIRQLISEGIHVNVTLLFAVDAYEAVHEAYLAGLEARHAQGLPVSGIASVASFFVSRIDAAVGQQIAVKLEQETRAERRKRLEALDGKVAIANARLAYARFLETLASDRWQRLAAAGADPQRVLWASTGTKDPKLPPSLYVDELIGRHTVNTLPDATLAAFLEQGRVRDALGRDPASLEAQATAILSELDALGISLEAITDDLLTRGCALFSDAFDGLLLSVETKRQELLGDGLPTLRAALGDAAAEVDAAAVAWHQQGRSRALWRRQADLWSDADEARWLGWLDLPTAPPEVAIGPPALRAAVREHPAETAVVIGMGGSSLWPDVLGRTLAEETAASGRARALRVLDSTLPVALERQLDALDLERCLFFVSSKSGSTIEPNAIFELVHARLVERVGREAAGRHFVAITDPGSALESRARELGFLGTALGRPDVGGRFSALSPFGLLPAEAMGLDPEALQARARRLHAACGPFVPPDHNPGVALGVALGGLARAGRDKLTLTTANALAPFTDWIEQLVAESTGKHGRGIVPIAGEALGPPERYAEDRVFVDIALAGDPGAATRARALEALEAAGQTVIRIALASRLDLVQEVFRWEIATAVAGALLGVNPFDQPDVEAAKIASRAILGDGNVADVSEALPGAVEASGLRLFPSPALGAGGPASLDDLAASLVGAIGAGDTFSIDAFLDDTPATRAALQAIRERVGAAKRIATTLDFGPRYLHSTGQLQKGGPNRLVGLFLWQDPVARDAAPLPIPGLGGDFDGLATAQAIGDLRVLAERGRRILGVALGADVAADLDRLRHAIDRALEDALEDALEHALEHARNQTAGPSRASDPA